MNKLPSIARSLDVSRRCLSTSAALMNKKNFRKFYVPSEMRGTKQFRERQKSDKRHPHIPLETWGVRETFIPDEHGNTVEVAEMIPELVVPDLTGFKLKPYVSYRTSEFTQCEFTAEDLFNAVYSSKVVDDWNKKQLNEDGTPKQPSDDETLDVEEAFRRARQTGADIFGEKPVIEDHI